jgi:hypothetical protein
MSLLEISFSMLQSTPLRSTRARFGYERIKRDHFTVKKRGGAALVVAWLPSRMCICYFFLLNYGGIPPRRGSTC